MTDSLASCCMLPTSRDAYIHVSHPFTHEEFADATYNNATREISFNQAWLKQLGFTCHHPAGHHGAPQRRHPPGLSR